MFLADIHAHLEFFGKDVAAVVKRAEAAGVAAIVTAGIDPATNRAVLQLSRDFAAVKAALGIYPVHALSLSAKQVEEELQFIHKHRDAILAIGEIGLDYQETDDRKRQQDAFEAQLALAARLKKPAIVHSRKAEEAVVETLTSSSARNVVLHAFHGSMVLVKHGIDAGYYFSVTANINRSDHLQRLVRTAPLSSLLTETDSPFMGPEKEGSSEPAMVAETVKAIARIKGTNDLETANMLFANYQCLFGKEAKYL